LRPLVRLTAVAIVVPCAVSMAIGLWVLTSSTAEHRNLERATLLKTLATQTCVALEPLLASNELTAARKIVASAGSAAGVTRCSLVLPDGRVLADSEVRAINIAQLPHSWTGPVDALASELHGSGPYITRAIAVPGRGILLLHIQFAHATTGVSTADATGFALLAIVVLLLVWVAMRRLQARLTAVGKLTDAVQAVASNPHAALEEFKLSETRYTGCEAWNVVIGRFASLEQCSRATTARSLLATRDGSVSTASHEGDRGGLGAVVDLLPTGVLLIDAEGKVSACNGAALALLGTEAAQILGVDIRAVLQDDAFVQVITATLKRAFGGERRTLEIARHNNRDGVIRLHVRPLRRDDHGGCLVTIEDITQQRIADAARNQFVAHATHELRAPLTNIRLCLEATLDVDDALNAEELMTHLNQMNDETRRLERLVSDLLSVAAIEAGSLELKEDDVRLDRLFQELQANNADACREKGLDFVFELPPKFPLMRGDREKVAAAIQNLVSNAVKYTPSGGKVSVSAYQENDRFRVEVADTGFGIAESEHHRIFERFYRASDPRVCKITGTGLGLALSKEVARLHGGDLSFKSELNQGSTFTFELPVARQPA
jgi:PAS domain S-box-containing protein